MRPEPHGNAQRELTRRHFFHECGVGLGKIALASLLCREAGALSVPNPMPPAAPGFVPRAKHVIYLFMSGAPSQLDLFDYKPTLVKYDGKPVPAEVVKDQRYAFIQRDAALMASRFGFAKHGDSGAELSEVLPHLSGVADEISIVRSMWSTQFNHAPAQIFMNTGSPQLGRPAMGAWVTYGLGTEVDDLPGFIVLHSGAGASGGVHNWGCGFMPTRYQGVPFRSQGDPVLDVGNPKGIDPGLQRASIDLINELNLHHHDQVGDPEIKPYSEGVPVSTKSFAHFVQANDANQLEDVFKRHGARIGCLLIEPIMGNCLGIAAEPEYLKAARELCDKHGVVLLIDEVKTGFRVARGGVQELYGIDADLCTFAKALGLELDGTKNGMGIRAKRFALYAEDGIVKAIQVEAPGEFRVSSAEAMLKAIDE